MSVGRRYSIQEELGRGGFGTVYRAKLEGEGGFSKSVALKVLNPEAIRRALSAQRGDRGEQRLGEADEMVEEFTRRLRDEARILGLLKHRAIVHVDELIVWEGRWTIVMELVEGISLDQLLKQEGQIPPRAAIGILQELAGALEAAYNQSGHDGKPLRLIHRDIKPGNVRLTPRGEVKLLDFGIARAEFDVREAETRSLWLGSTGYAAPERLDMSRPVTGPEADIYALGVMLYEMLAAEPFGIASPREDRYQEILAQKLSFLRELHPDPRSTSLEILLESLLSYHPQKRPDAGILEEACELLVRDLEGESLRSWAREVVPRLQSLAPPPPELPPRQPREISPESPHPPAPEGAPSEAEASFAQKGAAREPALPGAKIAGAIFAGVLLLTLALLSRWRGGEEPAPEVSHTEDPRPVPPPEAPALTASIELTVLPARVEPRRTLSTEEPDDVWFEALIDTAAPEALPEEPDSGLNPWAVEEEPYIALPKSATVVLSGSAVAVELRSPTGARLPVGPVPPGRYSVYAAFKSGSELRLAVEGEGELKAGEIRGLQCDARFQSCKWL